MGADRVIEHGLEDDPWAPRRHSRASFHEVLASPRSDLSSTAIRKLLMAGGGLEQMLGAELARSYQQSFEDLECRKAPGQLLASLSLRFWSHRLRLMASDAEARRENGRHGARSSRLS